VCSILRLHYRRERELELIWWFYDEIKETLHVFFRIISSERRSNKKDEIAGEFSVIRQPFRQVKYISSEESIFRRLISYV
jgi:hypothetical protein